MFFKIYDGFMKVRILVNGNARAVRFKKVSVNLFNRFLSDDVTLRQTESIEQIDPVVNECWEEDIELVLLTTGDGGLHRFLSSFVRIYGERQRDDGSVKNLPLFATLRTGTANLVTGILGVPGKPQKAVQRLFARLEQVRNSEELPRIRQKLLAVSDGIQERFGFIAGTGVIYNFFLEYYQGARYSISRFVKIFSHAAVSLFTRGRYLNRLFAEMDARLHLDQQREKLSRWKMMAVSAIDTRIVFFRAFRVGHLIDRIHIKAGTPNRLAIIRNIPNLLLNRELKGRMILDRIVQQVKFEREEEFGYTIDGELYNARMLELSPGPVVEFVRL